MHTYARPKPPGKGTVPEYYGALRLPTDRALHSLELFGSEVLPQLHAA